MQNGHGLKDRLKTALKQAVLISGRENARPRILTYHSVGHRDHPMNVSTTIFRDQMAWLADSRPCITVEDALRGRDGVAITFDDGYRDNLLNAHPILDQFKIPWTLFFVAGRAGQVLPHDTDVENAVLLTFDELRQLHRSGVSIGGHSMTHPRLSSLSPDQQEREIAGCFKKIAVELGAPPAGFAYPFGSALDYDKYTVEAVKNAGFGYALSNRYGPLETTTDSWTARRIWIDRTDSFELFKAKVSGKLDNLRLLDSPAGIRARRLLSPLARSS